MNTSLYLLLKVILMFALPVENRKKALRIVNYNDFHPVILGMAF